MDPTHFWAGTAKNLIRLTTCVKEGWGSASQQVVEASKIEDLSLTSLILSHVKDHGCSIRGLFVGILVWDDVSKSEIEEPKKPSKWDEKSWCTWQTRSRSFILNQAQLKNWELKIRNSHSCITWRLQRAHVASACFTLLILLTLYLLSRALRNWANEIRS